MKALSSFKPRVNWREYAVPAYKDERQIIRWIVDLYGGGQPFDLDPTYSKGVVWRDIPQPRLKGDLHPCGADVQEMDARSLKFGADTLGSIYFDPPMIGKDVEREGAKLGKIEQRFSGYKSMGELWRMYGDALSEFYRVLKPGGIVAFKCMDLISGGKFYASSVEIANQSRKVGFCLDYIFVLYRTGHGIMSPNMKRQLNPRHNHVYYVILRKPK